MKTKTLTTPRLGLKRQDLLSELRHAVRLYNDHTNTDLLEFCNINLATLEVDAAWKGVPWRVTQLHYFTLGIRAIRARACGRFPDGSPAGSDNPSATTPPLAQILIHKQPGDTSNAV